MRTLILAALLLLTGCACQQAKPGTIVSVNDYCAVENDDPVDPALTAEYKGQKVGFCCEHCVPKWNAMTDTQKDAALAKAVAKGKVKKS